MKFKAQLFLSILVLFSVVKSDYSDPVEAITEFSKLQPVVSGQLDHTATIIFDHPDCDKCGQIESIIQQYAEDNEGFTKTFVIDCESMYEDTMGKSSLPMCGPDHIQNLPLILFFEPSSGQPKQHAYQGGASVKELSNFLRKHMPNFTHKLKNEQEYQEFLEADEYEHKVVLFTNKEKTSPLYKALGSTYRDRILFGEIHESNTEVVEKFKVSKYPTLYLLKKNAEGEHKPEKYLEELKFEQINEFLEDFSLSQKVKRKFIKGRKGSQQQKSEQKQQNQQQQKQEKKQKLPDVNKISIDKYEKQVLQLEKPVLIHITKGDEKHPQWEEILQKYQQLFDYFSFEVTNDEQEKQAKEILKARSVPGIRYLPPGTIKKPYSSFTFSAKDVDMKEIHSEFQYQIPDQTISVSDEQMFQQQIQQQLQQQKIAIVYLFEKDVSLGLRVANMQEVYQKKFGIVSYQNPVDAIKQQFGVQKLPAMVALFRQADLKEQSATENPDDSAPKEGEQVQAAQFQGKFNYFEITNFFNAFIQMKEGVKSTKKISEISSRDDFDKECTGSRNCFIAILNGQPKERDDEDSKLNESLKILQKLSDKYGTKGANFHWIDGTCHSEILYPLNMSDDEIPNFILYNHGKKKFAKMIGRFEESALRLFIEKGFKGQVNYQPLNLEEFKIKSVECIEEHARIEQRRIEREEEQKKQLDEDDDIMKEILEEERLKREALENELNSEKKKKKKKKRKGSKKSDL